MQQETHMEQKKMKPIQIGFSTIIKTMFPYLLPAVYGAVMIGMSISCLPLLNKLSIMAGIMLICFGAYYNGVALCKKVYGINGDKGDDWK